MVQIGVVGAPAVGKSSLMLALAERVGFANRFEDPSDYPLVHNVGGDSAEWQFLNQVSFQIRKIETATFAGDRDELIEFDWYASHLFWTAASERVGLISSAHAAALGEIFNAAVSAGVPRPSAYLHLIASPELVAQRMSRRAREYEQTDVMSDLTLALLDIRLTGSDAPVLELDASDGSADIAATAVELLRAGRIL